MPIDVNKIREDKVGKEGVEAVKESERLRGRASADTVGNAIKADSEWRNHQFTSEKLKEKINAVQKQISTKKKESKGKDPCTELLEEKDTITKELEVQEKITEDAVTKRDKLLTAIGNLVCSTVPVSNDEADNRVERMWGDSLVKVLSNPQSSKPVYGSLSHHQILRLIGGYDQARGVKVVGHRGYFLKGVGVMLNMALINYGINYLISKGYMPMQPPYFMKQDVMGKTAELADFDDQLYKVQGSKQENSDESNDYYLIATSEQPISAYHSKEWLAETELPKMYAGVSSCFRKEAGSHGKETWGLFRIHQFEKVEQFVITNPEESQAKLEEMIGSSEGFFQSLKIPYRVVSIVSGALNDAASKKYDLEAWFPSYQEYKELVSCSNCTDFQSRALEIRCGHAKQGDREKRYVHMLNGTLCATQRAMCCVLENYQTESGVNIPAALQPYMGGKTFLPFLKEEMESFDKEHSK